MDNNFLDQEKDRFAKCITNDSSETQSAYSNLTNRLELILIQTFDDWVS